MARPHPSTTLQRQMCGRRVPRGPPHPPKHTRAARTAQGGSGSAHATRRLRGQQGLPPSMGAGLPFRRSFLVGGASGFPKSRKLGPNFRCAGAGAVPRRWGGTAEGQGACAGVRPAARGRSLDREVQPGVGAEQRAGVGGAIGRGRFRARTRVRQGCAGRSDPDDPAGCVLAVGRAEGASAEIRDSGTRGPPKCTPAPPTLARPGVCRPPRRPGKETSPFLGDWEEGGATTRLGPRPSPAPALSRPLPGTRGWPSPLPAPAARARAEWLGRPCVPGRAPV